MTIELLVKGVFCDEFPELLLQLCVLSLKGHVLGTIN